MKIVSITSIKNESDIIESFVRYHLNIVDFMIFLNSGSTDDTLNILNSLIDENLPIVVIEGDGYFEPYVKYNYLLNLAINDYGADVICPLDCDEFIIAKSGNPRDIIVNIPENSYYKLKWKTFVPTSNDDQNIKFIPSRVNHVRDENLDMFSKVIISRDLVEKFNVNLSMGNHDIEGTSNQIKCITDSGLNLAHFPIRSVNQTISKVLISYPNTLSRKVIKKGVSFHYIIMFNTIKNKGQITMDDVTRFAKQYALFLEGIHKKFIDDSLISIKKDSINLDFCKNLEIKYSYEENPIKNVLDNYVFFANEIHRLKNVN